MKILIVASNMVHINHFHRPYIQKFKELGHDVSVMANGEDADFCIPFEKKTFSPKNFCLTFAIRKIIKKEKFDLILLHTSLGAFVVRLALLPLKNRPYVINTVHGYLFGDFMPKWKSTLYLTAEKMLRRVTDEIFVMNTEDNIIALQNDLCIGGVSEIEGMGIDLSKIDFVHREEPANPIELCYVGELNRRKNQIFLVEAMKQLEGYHLTLVGDGTERKKIERTIAKNHLENKVSLVGYQSPKPYLENADIYVCASKIEGLPFNIMEAMKAKLPIVSTDIKGVRDLLGERNLYPIGDVGEYLTLLKIISLGIIDYDLSKYEIQSVLERNVQKYLHHFE